MSINALETTTFREPSADGAVVGVEEEGGEDDAACEGGDGHGPYVGHGAGDVGETVVAVEEIHQGIVDDVEGVGEFAEQLAQTVGGGAGPGR